MVVAVLLASGAVALAGGSRQSAGVDFTSHRPGTSSGAALDIDYVNPNDPAAKPPSVRRVVVTLASGSRLNTRAPLRCHAPDALLTLVGGSACPAGSRLGTGVETVDTGIPGPGRIVTVDTEFFNNAHQLIYVNTIRGTAVRNVFRADVTRRRIVTNAPFLPGAPPDGGAIDTVHIRLPVYTRDVGAADRSYLTTPPTCPAGGSWTNSVRFTYADGQSQTTHNQVSCSG